MATTVGTGDLFGGGSADSSASSQSSLSQGSVGATLDLSSLQSIQGHTIVENQGISESGALSFAQLIAGTASASASSASDSVISGIQNTIASTLKNPLILAIAGLGAFFIAFKLFKRGR